LKDDKRLRQSVQCHGENVYFTVTVAVAVGGGVFKGVCCWLSGET